MLKPMWEKLDAAVDPLQTPRSVEWLDDTRVLGGKGVREGNPTRITATHQKTL